MGRLSRPGPTGLSTYITNYRSHYERMPPELRAVVDRICERAKDCGLRPAQIKAEAVDVVMREVMRPCQCQKCRDVSLEDRLAAL